MSKKGFIGARIDKDIINSIDDTAKEDNIDKTTALINLIRIGRKQYLLEKYLKLYREGRCSIDRAAEKAEITVSEMMEEAVKAGIRSSETTEEYKRGLKLLEHS